MITTEHVFPASHYTVDFRTNGVGRWDAAVAATAVTAGRLSAESPGQSSKKIRIAVWGRTANHEDTWYVGACSTVVIPSWARACSPRTTWPGFLPQPPRRVYSTVSQEPGCDIMCSLPVSHTASQSFCIGQLLRCKWSQCTFNRLHGIFRLSK